jgi:hypothetical protein
MCNLSFISEGEKDLSIGVLERSFEDERPTGLAKFCPLMSSENIDSYSSVSSDRVLDKEFSKAFSLGAKSELASIPDELLGTEKDFATRFVDCCCAALPLSP